MKTYSLKQLVGGFLLVLIFIILFVVNIVFKSNALNIKMFLNPILVALAICMLIYVIKLNELINLNKSKLNKNDTFELKSCPYDHKQSIDMTTINNKKFKNIKCDNAVHGSFYLNGDKNICGEGIIDDLNGCFNKYKLRKIKCDKINKFFENRDKKILSNWVEYRNNCT